MKIEGVGQETGGSMDLVRRVNEREWLRPSRSHSGESICSLRYNAVEPKLKKLMQILHLLRNHLCDFHSMCVHSNIRDKRATRAGCKGQGWRKCTACCRIGPGGLLLALRVSEGHHFADLMAADCTRSHWFPYRSLNTATVPYSSIFGSRTKTTPLAL